MVAFCGQKQAVELQALHCSNYSQCIKGRVLNLLAAEGGNDESPFWKEKKERKKKKYIIVYSVFICPCGNDSDTFCFDD